MLIRIRALTLAGLVLLLAACAGPVPKQASKEVLAPVRTIAVIRPPEPKTYTVFYMTSPAAAFGLVGGIIAASDMSSKQDTISAAFKVQGYAFSPALTDRIAARLTAMGYDAKVVDGPWEETDGKYKLPYGKIKSDADTVMVVTPTMVGFVAKSSFSDYMPTMTAIVVLLGKDRKEEIYKGYHASGWAPRSDGWRNTPPKVTFADFNALMADPKASGAALFDAGDAIAVTVAADLKK